MPLSLSWAFVARSRVCRSVTWLHHLFLGTHAMEVGNGALGRSHMEASMKLHPSVPAARALALMAPTADAAADAYRVAWAVWERLDPSKDPNTAQVGMAAGSNRPGMRLPHGCC